MDIDTSNANPIITYNNITVKKITISSISIDPLKRIANFTVSYWNGTVFLGQESYAYKATYITEITSQPTLKSISVSSTTSYTITINALVKVNGDIQYTQYTPFTFTSAFPYLTSGLTIYYSQIDPSIISLDSTSNTSYTSMSKDTRVIPNKYTYTGDFGTFTLLTNYASPSDNTGSGTIPYLSITNASYSFVDTSNIRVFYTVNDVQYNVKIASNLPCRAGITILYKNSDNLLSVTTDPTNFNIPFPIATTDILSVKSESSTTVSNSAIQTNIYDTTPIYKSVSALPTLTIYYNPNNISDISSTRTGNYTSSATLVSFTSVTFKAFNSYQFSNLNYTATNKNGTSVIVVTFQSKQLSITSSAIDSTKIYCNPLNTSDIGFQDDKTNYDNLINIISLTTTATNTTTTQFTNLIKTFNTTKNIAAVSMNSTRGTFSI
jgi:hypothetical protein